jgi:general nucleoside transport system permease protein
VGDGADRFVEATIRMATPLIYVAVGETYGERAGIMNIGLEGLMLIGACFAYTVGFFTGNMILALLGAVLVAMLFGLGFAYMTITVKANQVVMGVATNLIGLGVTGFIYQEVFAKTGLYHSIDGLPIIPIPVLSEIPFIGSIFFNHNILVYGIYFLIPIAWFVLNKTFLGLSLRTVGEHPRAVDSAGLSVIKLRYGAVLFSAAMCGLGGAFLSIGHATQFVEGMTAGRGYIAMTLVPFAGWRIGGVMWGGLLFGLAYAVQLRLQAAKMVVAYQFLQLLPYILTALVLIFSRRRIEQPKNLSVPYEGGA